MASTIIDATVRIAGTALQVSEDRARREAVQLLRKTRFAQINAEAAALRAAEGSAWPATSTT